MRIYVLVKLCVMNQYVYQLSVPNDQGKPSSDDVQKQKFTGKSRISLKLKMMDLHYVNRNPQRVDPERRAEHRAARKVRAWKSPLRKRALRSSLGLSILSHCLKFGIERLSL